MKGYSKTIVCMIVLGMMMIPFGYTASAEETTLQGGIQTVHLNLKTKPDFSPETTTEAAKEEQPPQSHTSGILDTYREAEWKEIGTWEADGVQYDTAYEGSAKFNIWWVQDPNDSEEYYADVQYNLGNSFKDLGKYEKAIEKYSKSLEIKPTYTNALTHLTAILIQLRRIDELELNKDFSNIFEKQSEHNKLLYLVYIMIEKFIKLDVHATKLLIDKLKKLINTDIFSELSKKDNSFVFAYHTFLTILLKNFLKENPNFKKESNNDSKIIYHIGESHCLSFAHKKIKIDNMWYTIKPRIIFGTKAWHLGNTESNSYKSFFKYQVNSILDGSIVFLSFGEIDCRVDEGIIQHYEEKGGSLGSIIKNTVENYLNFTENEFKDRNIKRLYFGIPAPKINETKSEQGEKINLLRVNIIKKFNIYLKSSLLKKNLNLADVYKLTSTSKGISNNKYHCDDIHLIPSTIDYFKKQIANLKF